MTDDDLCFCGQPLPDTVGVVLWCDTCLTEYLDQPKPREDMGAFIARKEAAAHA